ncbi:MAG: hydroxymethylbilane synthase [bacterium]|nr:hydroxymethylbilane synthase [Gammaproteobacteria bacterium]HIL95789.1 hydroxymethylbilane synthase [Pseudomonadales bacterium]
MVDSLRIATRQSALALWQAHHVKQQIETAHPGLEVTILGMTTEGDRNKRSPLSQIGGKGVFVKELEVALLDGRADIAVHSMKDVPSVLPPELTISAMCEREDPRDALVCNKYDNLEELPAGAKIGSSSLRRRLQLKLAREDLVYEELRGNVDTRLRKLDEDHYDAIILAAAGLKRLQLGDRISQAISTTVSIPAAGQGAVGIECRADSADLIALLDAINDPETYDCVTCEREVSIGLGANCNLPVAAFAEIVGANIQLNTYVSDTTGGVTIKLAAEGPRSDAREMAKSLTIQMIAQGADKLIDSHS